MGSGLIPRDFGGEVEVQVEDSTYWLRAKLGWFHREQAGKLVGVTIHLPYGKVKDGDIKLADKDTVPVTFEQMAETNLAKLMIWLTRWSHDEKPDKNTMKRLPLKHARALLKKIEELEEEQDGPEEESPLPESSSE